MEPHPTLQTQRLTLAPLTKADAERLFPIARNPASIEDFQYTAKTVEDVAKWVDESVESKTPAWTIRTGDTVLGLVEAEVEREAIARVGYFIDVEHQGNGYATEALRAVLDWLFTHTPVHRAQADIDGRNVGSRRVLEKTGFQYEGTQRKTSVFGTSGWTA